MIGVKSMYVDNLICFLRNENTRVIASKMLALKNSKLKIEKASDFDIYNVLCENLYLLCGHTVRKDFLSLLSEASSTDVSPIMLYDLDFRKKLWQKIFFDTDIELPIKTVDLKKSVDMTKQRNQDKVLNLNSEIALSFENIYSLRDYIFEKINVESISTVFFDAEKIEYIRPDDFHAQKAYENLACEKNASIVFLWLLCRIFMNRALKLILKVDNAKKAADIIALIHRFGVTPQIAIEVNIANRYDYNSFYKLLTGYAQKNISLKLFCPKEMEISDDFLNILKVIPLVFIESVDVNFQNIENAINLMITKDEAFLVISYLNLAK